MVFFTLRSEAIGKLIRDPSDSENVTEGREPVAMSEPEGGRGIATFCKDVQELGVICKSFHLHPTEFT